jgi:hypothetical protein
VSSTGTQSTWPALRAPLAVGAAGLASGVLLHLRDPHSQGSYGLCPFLLITGQPCPGCGGLRAVNLLTHGDVVGALASNAAVVALVVVLVVAWCVWLVRRVRTGAGRMVTLRGRTVALIAAAWIGFGVVRVLVFDGGGLSR